MNLHVGGCVMTQHEVFLLNLTKITIIFENVVFWNHLCHPCQPCHPRQLEVPASAIKRKASQWMTFGLLPGRIRSEEHLEVREACQPRLFRPLSSNMRSELIQALRNPTPQGKFIITEARGGHRSMSTQVNEATEFKYEVRIDLDFKKPDSTR